MWNMDLSGTAMDLSGTAVAGVTVTRGETNGFGGEMASKVIARAIQDATTNPGLKDRDLSQALLNGKMGSLPSVDISTVSTQQTGLAQNPNGSRTV